MNNRDLTNAVCIYRADILCKEKREKRARGEVAGVLTRTRGRETVQTGAYGAGSVDRCSLYGVGWLVGCLFVLAN